MAVTFANSTVQLCWYLQHPTEKMTRYLSSFPDSLRYKCTSCDELHQGLPHLSYPAPEYWSDSLASETSFLTDDLCSIANEDFFIHCLLEIPIQDTPEVLTWGVWSSLARDNFKLYADGASAGLQTSMFGWFSNSLPSYPETLNLKCAVRPREAGLRPLIELEPTDHPLSLDQRQGITVERALEFLEATGIRVFSV
jgi:hypothetical protein